MRLAQLDRASDYGSEGREFESSNARSLKGLKNFFRPFLCAPGGRTFMQRKTPDEIEKISRSSVEEIRKILE